MTNPIRMRIGTTLNMKPKPPNGPGEKGSSMLFLPFPMLTLYYDSIYAGPEGTFQRPG